MNEMSGVNVKVERGSTSTFTRDLSNIFIIKITRQGGFPLSPLGWISTLA